MILHPRPMPRPLSTRNEEAAFYAVMAESPLDAVTPLVFADWKEEHGEAANAEIVRSVEVIRQRYQNLHLSRPDHLALLRGRELTERESQEVLEQIRTVLCADPQTITQQSLTAIEAQLARTLGTPPHAWERRRNLNPRNPEQLRSQYEFQRTLLASLDLLESQANQLGITGMDHRFHRLPSLEEIQSCLQSPDLQRKVEQGFNQLLLVPFALPLKRLLEAFKQGLSRNEPPFYGLDRRLPVLAHDEEADWGHDLVYFPRAFSRNHGGKTKLELLGSGKNGWDILLVEGNMTSIPPAGSGEIIGGRLQIESGKAASEYLHSLPADESGWTPETYILSFLQLLERTGGNKVLDVNSHSYLIGAFFASSHYDCVPMGSWAPLRRRVSLSHALVNERDPANGVRVAVRVM